MNTVLGILIAEDLMITRTEIKMTGQTFIGRLRS